MFSPIFECEKGISNAMCWEMLCVLWSANVTWPIPGHRFRHGSFPLPAWHLALWNKRTERKRVAGGNVKPSVALPQQQQQYTANNKINRPKLRERLLFAGPRPRSLQFICFRFVFVVDQINLFISWKFGVFGFLFACFYDCFTLLIFMCNGFIIIQKRSSACRVCILLWY